MRRRCLAIALCCLALLLAGCVGLPVDEPDGADGRSSGDQADGATPDVEDPSALPPGVHENGSVDESVLVARSRRAARDEGWVIRSGDRDTSPVVSYGADDWHVDVESSRFSRGNRSVTNRTGGPADYEVDVLRRPYRDSSGSDPVLTLPWLEDARLRYDDTERTSSGGWTRLSAEGGASVTVDDRGRVRLIRRLGQGVRRIDYGPSVTPPPWVDRVPHLEAEHEADWSLVRVAHRGGVPIPAGTAIELTHPWGFEFELAEPLRSGDDLYVGVREVNGTRELVTSRSRPATRNLVQSSDHVLEGEFETERGDRVRFEVTVSEQPN